MPLPSGSQFGSYAIMGRLGAGGMGEVYKARDVRLDRDVALKILPETLATLDFRRRFLREAKTAASVTHPNIAHVYEIGEESGTCFIAMELVDGGTLRHMMSESPPRPIPELLGYLQQAAEAIAKAHSRGVVHRDLKPDNIMVTRDGYAKVLDFGLAKLIEKCQEPAAQAAAAPVTETIRPVSTAGFPMGTIGYMSPEQAEGKPDVDERSDVFSFGCILHEVATGQQPFAGESVIRAFHNLVYEPAARIPESRAGVPASLQAIIDRCLVKDPSQRTFTMAEVARALKEPAASLRAAHTTRSLSRKPWVSAAALLLLIACGAVLLRFYPTGRASIPSLAVIPFVNASHSADSEYLSDGISESLINALAAVPGLKVVARTSSFKFKGPDLDVRQAARSLGVETLVTGRVVPVGARLRVSVDLVNGADGTEIWGNQYSSEVAGLPNLQAEISSEIADHVRRGLTASERENLARPKSGNGEAWELLYRGKYQLGLYTPEGTRKAAAFFEQAVAADPQFALPQAELAYAYRLLSGGALEDPKKMAPLAEAAARKAIALDDSVAEGHAALGDILRDRWDWKGSESEYQRALALNPTLAEAHDGYAILLSVLSRHDEAIAEIRRMKERDPLSILAAVDLGAMYYNAGRYQQALDALQDAVNVDPTTPMTDSWMGIVYGATGRFSDAIREYEKAIARGDTASATRCYYAYSLARAGRSSDALGVLEDLHSSHTFVPPTGLAIVYTGLGRTEAAIRALDQAFRERDPMLQYLNVEPHFNAIRADPRFQELIRKVGLPR